MGTTERNPPATDWNGRPYWYESHQVRPPAIMASGAVSTLFIGAVILATYNITALTLVTFTASSILGAASVLLARYGDRGAAVGTAAVAGTAAAIAIAAAGAELVLATMSKL